MNTYDDPIEIQFREITSDQLKGYGDRPIPCELDEKVERFVNLFIQSPPSDKRCILGMVNYFLSGTLICFAERMASMGVREKSRDRLKEGLVALLMEDYFGDWRDNLTILSPLYHAAQKIGVNADELFLEAASLVKSSVSISFIEFTKRMSANRSLKAFHYAEGDDADGFRYKRTHVYDDSLLKKLGVDLDD